MHKKTPLRRGFFMLWRITLDEVIATIQLAALIQHPAPALAKQLAASYHSFL
jgi:hypothetical protein